MSGNSTFDSTLKMRQSSSFLNYISQMDFFDMKSVVSGGTEYIFTHADAQTSQSREK